MAKLIINNIKAKSEKCTLYTLINWTDAKQSEYVHGNSHATASSAICLWHRYWLIWLVVLGKFIIAILLMRTRLAGLIKLIDSIKMLSFYSLHHVSFLFKLKFTNYGKIRVTCIQSVFSHWTEFPKLIQFEGKNGTFLNKENDFSNLNWFLLIFWWKTISVWSRFSFLFKWTTKYNENTL